MKQTTEFSLRLFIWKVRRVAKRELDQSLERAREMQSPLKNLVQGVNHELELSQTFFLDNNVDCGQQQQQHFISIKLIHNVGCARKKDIV